MVGSVHFLAYLVTSQALADQVPPTSVHSPFTSNLAGEVTVQQLPGDATPEPTELLPVLPVVAETGTSVPAHDIVEVEENR